MQLQQTSSLNSKAPITATERCSGSHECEYPATFDLELDVYFIPNDVSLVNTMQSFNTS